MDVDKRLDTSNYRTIEINVETILRKNFNHLNCYKIPKSPNSTHYLHRIVFALIATVAISNDTRKLSSKLI